MAQLFLDCDGVLADFDGYFRQIFSRDANLFEKDHGSKVMWENLATHEDFYFKLPLLPDAYELFQAVEHLKPIILTGRPKNGEWVVEQKHRWTDKHFPGVETIVCLSKDKNRYMTGQGDVLVDDRLKYAPLWRDAGGVFVCHLSAQQSIRELRQLGVL